MADPGLGQSEAEKSSLPSSKCIHHIIVTAYTSFGKVSKATFVDENQFSILPANSVAPVLCCLKKPQVSFASHLNHGFHPHIAEQLH